MKSLSQALIFFTVFLYAAIAHCSDSSAFTTNQNGFICDWLIAGPYPCPMINNRPENADTDFINEEQSRPFPEKTEKQAVFEVDKGKIIAEIGATNEWGFRDNMKLPVQWKRLHSDKSIIVMDGKFKPIDDFFVYYAACYIESAHDTDVRLRVGSDDDHKIWLNSKLIGSVSKAQGITPDSSIYNAKLRRGINLLLMKIIDRTRGTGFCLAISDRNDNPLNGYKIYIEDPARKNNADVYDNGFTAKFDLKGLYVPEGETKTNIEFNAPDSGQYELECMGQKVKCNRNYIWPLTLNFINNQNEIVVTVYEIGKNDPVAILRRDIKLYSPKTVKIENAILMKKIQKLKNETKNGYKQKLHTQIADLKNQLNHAYVEVESKYSSQRIEAQKTAKKSIDEPMVPNKSRARLCMNGQWQGSPDRKNWSYVRLPAFSLLSFSKWWFYPPDGTFKDFKLNQNIFCRTNVWFKHDFEGDRTKSYNIVCNTFIGRLTVYVNGQLSGEFLGETGIAEIPLIGVADGKNTIELNVQSLTENNLKSYYDYSGKFGILSDIYLDCYNPVHVSDVWVKPSWRHAKLTTSTRLENRSDLNVKVKLKQYAAKDGRVKFCLPEQEGEISPKGFKELITSGLWADPKIWGIGHPEMYDLVSDLYIDDKLIDRHIQPFGFREFWIYAVDFYLNGKRIILQGDSGYYYSGKDADVMLPLQRKDNINIYRLWNIHYSPALLRRFDRQGMLAYLNMQPHLPISVDKKNATVEGMCTLEDAMKMSIHNYNLDNYRNWFRSYRNNPSVVIWSIDNETFTQGKDQAALNPANIVNDKLAAFYGQFMKSLDPDIVITRDGDQGSWGHIGRWQENPPCDTANYHYPELNFPAGIDTWQQMFDFRPVIWGETLYHGYGPFDGNPGATPSQVDRTAREAKSLLRRYIDAGVPAVMTLGFCVNGFIQYDDTGKGNPWGIKADPTKIDRKNKRYWHIEWKEINWPAFSGEGLKVPAVRIIYNRCGKDVINWFDAKFPSHIRNKVNDAFRDSLIPQPPLISSTQAECIIESGIPNEVVWAESELGERYGVVSDEQGRAWFMLPNSGNYTFIINEKQVTQNIPTRGSYAPKPGFDEIPRFSFKGDKGQCVF